MKPCTIQLNFQQGPLPDPMTETKGILVWLRWNWELVLHLEPHKDRNCWASVGEEEEMELWSRNMNALVGNEVTPQDGEYLWAYWPEGS